MSLPFLEAFIQDYAPAQRRALENLANSATRALGDDEVAALLAKVQSGTNPLFEAPVFGAEIVDACKINTALESLKADLTALLLQAQELEQISVKHNQIHRSIVTRLHQAILKLDEVILTNLTRRLNPDVTEVKFVDFYEARNEAVSRHRAIVEQDTGQLVCGYLLSDKYLGRGGDQQARFTTTVLSTGVNPDAGRSFFPEDAARTGNNYVWAEVLLADAPMTGRYDLVDYNGALVQMIVELPQSEEVNELRLAPFGRYPIQLIAAEYDDGNQWQDIGIAAPVTLEFDSSALRFETISCRRIKLVFYQPDYTFREMLLESGQLKRTNYLNVMLDRTLEDSINDEPTGEFKLKTQRRELAKDALREQLGFVSGEDATERYTAAMDRVIDVDNTKLIRVTKYQYVVGLRALEVNYKRYSRLSEYRGSQMKASSSIYELELKSEETHFDNTLGNPATAVEWELDLGGGETINVLPNNADVITEVLKLDATLDSTTRFIENTVSPTRTVYRDGIELVDTVDYTISAPTLGQPITVTLLKPAWIPNAVYYIAYRPIGTEATVNLTAGRLSLKPDHPEVFDSTKGELNRIDIKAHPFILREIASDKDNWSRPDPFDAIWDYSPPPTRSAVADRPFVALVDGEQYGDVPDGFEADDGAAGPILPATTPITITDNSTTPSTTASSVPEEGGIIQIGREKIKYGTSVMGFPATSFTISDLIRGWDNTEIPASHPANTPVRWITKRDYRPIEVTFNGLHCRNITNYTTGKHPVFTDRSGPPQYIHIGTSLYFDRPLTGRIEVTYRRLADYIQVKSRLYSLDPTGEYTPVVNNYALQIKASS